MPDRIIRTLRNYPCHKLAGGISEAIHPSRIGEALGFIAVVVGLGATVGRSLEHSGGGRALADWLLDKFGRDRAAWAVLVAAFLVGLPIFFKVGFAIVMAAQALVG